MIIAPPLWPSHDAGTLPWVAVAGYLFSAALCALKSFWSSGSRKRLFWLVTGLAMVALGINKQLDLQTQFTAFMRVMARDDGWYHNRRAFQTLFIEAAGAATFFALGGLLWLVRELEISEKVALTGVSLLALFVMVRAASFHHIDILMQTSVIRLKLHTVMELSGIAVVFAGAALPTASRLDAIFSFCVRSRK